MSLIKIFANGIELDFVKDTLSIKKENTALSRDFKVAHSTFPFLIIENLAAKQALGTRALASVNKIKTVEVTIFEGGKKYLGELQILSYLNGFRKCNLKYASELLSIMNSKISSFMPIVSVIPGETSPIPFTETGGVMQTPFGHPTDWLTYPVPFISQGFPDVKWQFPTMEWKNKFGEALTTEDEWVDYQGRINLFNEDLDEFIENEYVDTAYEVISVSNKNVPSPQMYLLTPLFYALASKGFTATGDFYTDNFIKKLLIQSSKTNLTKTDLLKLLHTYTFPAAWVASGGSYYKREYFTVAVNGDYTLEYSLTFSGPSAYSEIPLYMLKYLHLDFSFVSVEIFKINEITTSSITVTGTIDFKVTNSQIIYIYLFSKTSTMPTSYSLVLKKKFVKDWQQMHPTIQTGRYLPEWTFATYLNALQNLFNLQINIDDFSKKMEIKFNDENLSSGAKQIINKSLAVTGYDQTPNNAFLLKYENDEDAALWITTSGALTYGTQTSDFSETLSSKFKLIPHTYTANLSEEVDSKTGVGLMIYDHSTFPYTVTQFAGQNLSITGAGGIYETYWKKWLKFRLNASSVEMSGPFTETELNQILDLKRIFVDNQEYIIQDVQYSETLQDNFNVNLTLLSVNL
jgi:hypothetical protein